MILWFASGCDGFGFSRSPSGLSADFSVFTSIWLLGWRFWSATIVAKLHVDNPLDTGLIFLNLPALWWKGKIGFFSRSFLTLLASVLCVFWPPVGLGRFIPKGLLGRAARARLTLLLDVQEHDLRLKGSFKFQKDSWSALKFVPNVLLGVVVTLEDLLLKVEKEMMSKLLK